MGFLDNLIKAVQDGALDDQLTKIADTIEGASGQLDKTLGTVAEKPGEVLKAAEGVQEQVVQKATQVGGALKKNIDIIQS